MKLLVLIILLGLLYYLVKKVNIEKFTSIKKDTFIDNNLDIVLLPEPAGPSSAITLIMSVASLHPF